MALTESECKASHAARIRDEVAKAAAVSVDLLGVMRAGNAAETKEKAKEAEKMYLDMNYVRRKKEQLRTDLDD